MGLFVAGALYSLPTKVLTNRVQVSAGTQNVLLTGTATVLGLLLSPFFGGISLNGVFPHMTAVIVLVLCASFGGMTFFIGQRHLDVSTTQIAFSSILLWGVLLSVSFLGSHFPWLQGFGITLLLGAIILVVYRRGKHKIDVGVASGNGQNIRTLHSSINRYIVSKPNCLKNHRLVDTQLYSF